MRALEFSVCGQCRVYGTFIALGLLGFSDVGCLGAQDLGHVCLLGFGFNYRVRCAGFRALGLGLTGSEVAAIGGRNRGCGSLMAGVIGKANPGMGWEGSRVLLWD